MLKVKLLKDCRISIYNIHDRESVISNAALGKTTILEICGRGVSNYEMCPYITNVADPQIRSYIAKLRIDCNKLADSKYRRYGPPLAPLKNSGPPL